MINNTTTRCDRTRLSPRVSHEVALLAKGKAAACGITLEYAIEQLLLQWIAGEISLMDTAPGAPHTKQ